MPKGGAREGSGRKIPATTRMIRCYLPDVERLDALRGEKMGSKGRMLKETDADVLHRILDALEGFQEWAGHRDWCRLGTDPDECDCGYSAFLEKVGIQEKSSPA